MDLAVDRELCRLTLLTLATNWIFIQFLSSTTHQQLSSANKSLYSEQQRVPKYWPPHSTKGAATAAPFSFY
ncbi:MAG: hypothetical protein ACI9SY_000540 [Candidatus Paceibacteria bacterium]|jgi:nicotinamidase-related amidase